MLGHLAAIPTAYRGCRVGKHVGDAVEEMAVKKWDTMLFIERFEWFVEFWRFAVTGAAITAIGAVVLTACWWAIRWMVTS